MFRAAQQHEDMNGAKPDPPGSNEIQGTRRPAQIPRGGRDPKPSADFTPLLACTMLAVVMSPAKKRLALKEPLPQQLTVRFQPVL